MIAIALVVTVFALVGGYFALRQYKLDRPAPMWVPIPVKQEPPREQREKTIAEIEGYLRREDVLLRISRELGLASRWKMPSEKAAAAELGNRVFVRFGEAETPNGRSPALHIGVHGTVREQETSGRIAEKLMAEIGPKIGLHPQGTP